MDSGKLIDRHYGIDLLRILSMFMICILHTLGHGGILENTRQFTLNYEIAWLLEIAAYGAVNCYAMISGYVGVMSKKQKYTSIAVLWLQVLCYCVIQTVIYAIFKPGTVGLKTCIKAFFPVFTVQYWYFTAYVLLFFMMPFLSAALRNLSEKQIRYTLIILFILLSVLPTVFRRDVFNTGFGYSALWLAVLYLIGGYIKLYEPMKKLKKKHFTLLFIACVVITWVFKLFMELSTLKILGESKWGNLLIAYTSPTIVLASIFLFLCFSRMEFIHGRKVIVFFAPLSFGVYLIHENPLFRANIMSKFFEPLVKLHWSIFPLAVVCSAIIIYIGCSFIDYIRLQFFNLLKIKNRFQKLETKLIDKHLEKD